jgi:hypothetical protein
MAKSKVVSAAQKQKDLEKFTKSLKNKTVDELLKLEQEIIAEGDKVNETITKTLFDLPTETYEDVAAGIRYFINKKTVQWQYTLAMVTMYDFWTEKNPGKIPYATLDTTLRTLGEQEFTGYGEWQKVVLINKYFEPLRKAYMATTELAYDNASRHSAIMSELQLKDPNKANQGVEIKEVQA